MSGHDSNPFVRFDLDPGASLGELTERLRGLAEDASDEERAELRAAWVALSRSPARRLELVLEAGPARAPIPGPRAGPVASAPWPDATLADLLSAPPLAPALPPETAQERALHAVDLSFLVREGEKVASGELAARRPR